MFDGTYPVNLDIKSRLAIPVKLRNQLVSLDCNQIKITAHPDRCLIVYPMATWETVAQKLRTFPSMDAQARGWKRLVIGHAETLELDAAGRILLSPNLRAFAKLDKNLMLVGQSDYIELWDADKWHAGIDAFDPNGPMPSVGSAFYL